MTHRPYTPPAWQAKPLADGRVTLLVVPLTRLLKRGAISDFGPSDTAGYDWHFRDSWKRWHEVRHSRLLELLPYAPGDLIWCREAYIGAYAYEVNEYKPKDWGNKPSWFPADGPIPERFVGQFWHKARSPVTMPKWAARTWLRCIGVEVRRVQTISEDEAVLAGTEPLFSDAEVKAHPDIWGTKPMPWKNYLWHGQRGLVKASWIDAWPHQYSDYSSPRDAYSSLWCSLHGPDAWAANPWAAFVAVEKISKEDV